MSRRTEASAVGSGEDRWEVAFARLETRMDEHEKEDDRRFGESEKQFGLLRETIKDAVTELKAALERTHKALADAKTEMRHVFYGVMGSVTLFLLYTLAWVLEHTLFK